MAFTNLEKTDMVLINGEALGHSDIQASTPNLRWKVSSKDISLDSSVFLAGIFSNFFDVSF
jgi:hypothetical protein